MTRLAPLVDQAREGCGDRRGSAYPRDRALGRTLRWKIEGASTTTPSSRGRQPIMAFWHGRIFAGALLLPPTAASSSSPARTSTANGSRASSSGSASAPRAARRRAAALGRCCSCVRDMAAGQAGGIHARRSARARARRAARRRLAGRATGNPVLPFHIEAASVLDAGSWDRTQIPKPFSDRGARRSASRCRRPGPTRGASSASGWRSRGGSGSSDARPHTSGSMTFCTRLRGRLLRVSRLPRFSRKAGVRQILVAKISSSRDIPAFF